MAYAANYSRHCRGKDTGEVILAQTTMAAIEGPFFLRGHNLVVPTKVIAGFCCCQVDCLEKLTRRLAGFPDVGLGVRTFGWTRAR